MASLDFPTNPTDQQTYTLNGITYQYNAAIGAWLTVVVGSQPVTLANNKQVLYSNNGLISGTNGLVYDSSANTLHANTVIVAGSAIPSGNVFNLAYATANAGFAKANAALANTSGTFAGDLSITGIVGIGTSTAYGKFNVVGGRSFCIANNETYSLGVGFNSSTGGYYYLGASNSATPDLIFSQVGGSERMRITNDGSIGIGVASPSYGFHHRVFGNSELATQYGTGIATYLGAYASEGSVRVTGNNPMTLWTNGAERMKIDGSGRVTKPNQPYFYSYLNCSSASGNANQIYGTVTNGLSWSTDRVTVPVAGVYMITFMNIANDTSATRYDSQVLVNGACVAQALNDAAGGYHQKSISIAWKCSASDYIQFYTANWYNTNANPGQWITCSITLLG